MLCQLCLNKKLSFKHEVLSTFQVFNSYMWVVATTWDSAGLRPLHLPESSPWLLISGIFHKLLRLKFPSLSSQTNLLWSPPSSIVLPESLPSNCVLFMHSQNTLSFLQPGVNKIFFSLTCGTHILKCAAISITLDTVSDMNTHGCWASHTSCLSQVSTQTHTTHETPRVHKPQHVILCWGLLLVQWETVI